MRVYLVRHGEAKGKDEDPQRGLTDEGRRAVEAVGRLVARQAASVRSIWHSGRNRTAETAEILNECLGREGAARETLMHPGLSPDDPAAPVAAELRARTEDLVLVGHLPFLDHLALLLIGADPRHVPRILAFEPGAALCLESAEGGWLIAWFVNPALVLAPGRGAAG